MDADLMSYLVLLAVGFALTALVAVILRRSGQSVLEQVYRPADATRLSRLVTGAYFLATLGLLAVLSTVPLPIRGLLQLQVTRLGVALLILGFGYGLTLLIFNRLRVARRAEELDEEFEAAARGHRP